MFVSLKLTKCSLCLQSVLRCGCNRKPCCASWTLLRSYGSSVLHPFFPRKVRACKYLSVLLVPVIPQPALETPRRMLLLGSCIIINKAIKPSKGCGERVGSQIFNKLPSGYCAVSCQMNAAPC